MTIGQLEMVDSGGRYLLKPIPHGTLQRLNVLPINEHLTMQMARQVFDIEVAETIPPWASLWPWLIWPALVIVAFGLQQWRAAR